MRIGRGHRETVADICRDELKHAVDRVDQRLREMESQPVEESEDDRQTVRRFYEELADKVWTESDEESLRSLPRDLDCNAIKEMIREAFRSSAVFPIPSFAYLVALSKRMHSEVPRPELGSRNRDAVSAVEREHLANLLDERLQEAAEAIAQKLGLSDAKAALVKQELHAAQSQIVGHFTPLA